MATTYKSKSLVPYRKDWEMTRGGVRRFISFEAIVREFNERYVKDNDITIGYNVTEQGVEICYE